MKPHRPFVLAVVAAWSAVSGFLTAALGMAFLFAVLLGESITADLSDALDRDISPSSGEAAGLAVLVLLIWCWGVAFVVLALGLWALERWARRMGQIAYVVATIAAPLPLLGGPLPAATAAALFGAITSALIVVYLSLPGVADLFERGGWQEKRLWADSVAGTPSPRPLLAEGERFALRDDVSASPTATIRDAGLAAAEERGGGQAPRTAEKRVVEPEATVAQYLTARQRLAEAGARSAGEPAERNCPECGAANPVDNSFCESCGAHLPAATGPATGGAEDARDATSTFAGAEATKAVSSQPVLEGTPAETEGRDHIVCAVCGQANARDNRFCEGCGQSLATPA